MKKPSALLASDWHWREDIPTCRVDDFMQAQICKAKYAKEICDKYNIPLLIAGDIFDHWKPSPELLRIALEYMPEFICIPGQHDNQNHNLELFNKSGLAVLQEANKAEVILNHETTIDCDGFTVVGFPYGIEPKPRRKRRDQEPYICLIHMQISLEKAMFETRNAYDVLEGLKGYDLILSGDNHTRFDIEVNNRRLVNAGSVMRMDADQIDHKPCFYLWYAEDNSIEEIKIPIDKSVVVRTHINVQKEMDERIDTYIDSMKMDYSIKLNFRKNMQEHTNANKTEDNVKNIIWRWMQQ